MENLKGCFHLLCSIDGVAMIRVGSRCNVLLKEEWDLQTNDVSGWMASFKIKIEVAAVSLGYMLSVASAQPIFCCIEENLCCCYVPSEHVAQFVQKSTTLGSTFAIFLVAAVSSALYVTFLKVFIKSENKWHASVKAAADGTFLWAHVGIDSILPFSKLE